MKFGVFEVPSIVLRGVALALGLSAGIFADCIIQNDIGMSKGLDWLKLLGFLYLAPLTFIVFLIPKLTQLAELKSLRPKELNRLKPIVDSKIFGLWVVVFYCLFMASVLATTPTIASMSMSYGAIFFSFCVLGVSSIVYIFVGLMLIEEEIRDFFWITTQKQREREAREEYLKRIDSNSGGDFSDVDVKKRKTHTNGRTKKSP